MRCPSGVVPMTVSSALVQAMPSAADSDRRTAVMSAAPPGATSCGSNETLSPSVTTLPTSARCTRSGGTTCRISAGPASTTAAAGCRVAGSTVTLPPSASPRLPSVRSSQRSSPRAAPAAAGAASAAVLRCPVSRTPAQGARPSSASVSGCSRTMPRRASKGAVTSRAVSSKLLRSAGGYVTRAECRACPIRVGSLPRGLWRLPGRTGTPAVLSGNRRGTKPTRRSLELSSRTGGAVGSSSSSVAARRGHRGGAQWTPVVTAVTGPA